MKTFPLGFVMKKNDNEIQYKGVLDISGGATLCHRGDDFWKNQWKVTVSIIMTPILLCTRPRWSRGLASPLLDINVPIGDLTVTETDTGSHEAERTLIKIWWHYWHNVRSNHNYIPNTHKKILIISVIHTRNHVMNFRRYMKEFSFRHQVHAAHIILF